MTDLNLSPNIPDCDAIYAELIAAHEGMGDDDSAALNARLILILMNQIGDAGVIRQAIAAARPVPRKTAA